VINLRNVAVHLPGTINLRNVAVHLPGTHDRSFGQLLPDLPAVHNFSSSTASLRSCLCSRTSALGVWMVNVISSMYMILMCTMCLHCVSRLPRFFFLSLTN
jgi:hypothetical protein